MPAWRSTWYSAGVSWPSTPPRSVDGIGAIGLLHRHVLTNSAGARMVPDLDRRERSRIQARVPVVGCRPSAHVVRLAAWRTRRCWRSRGPSGPASGAAEQPRPGDVARRRHHQGRPRGTTSSRWATRSCTTSATGPVTLQRFPEGIDGEEFYQKNPPKGHARLGAHGVVPLPERAAARPDRGRRGGQRRVGGADEHRHLPPVAGAHRATTTTPTSCASTSTRSRGAPSRMPSRRRWRCAR